MKKLCILTLILIVLAIPTASFAGGLFKAIRCATGGTYDYVWPVEKHKNWPASASYKPTAIGFSLRNKTKQTLFVTVKNASLETREQQSLLQKIRDFFVGQENVYSIKPDEFFELPLDTRQSTTLKVLRASNLNQAREALSRSPLLTATFTPGKTMYVNFDGTRLSPQQGPLAGKINVTDRCYHLDKNVASSDIRSQI